VRSADNNADRGFLHKPSKRGNKQIYSLELALCPKELVRLYLGELANNIIKIDRFRAFSKLIATI
jgi:hypothetical protein